MTSAFLIIDMQMLMQHRLDSGREHVNPRTPQNIAALAAAFRAAGKPVLHVRHRDADPASPVHEDGAGYPPMPCAEALEGEPVFIKNTSSAFASTDLESWLRTAGIAQLHVTGAVAGFCVNSTVRAGADLCFKMNVVRDAVLGFDLPGTGLSARVIFDATMAHLASDFAEMTDTATLLAA